MPNIRRLPSIPTLLKWRDEGLTHKQMAERVSQMEGVTVGRSAISAALTRAGETDKLRYDDWVPWSVSDKHNGAYPVTMLRAMARYLRTGKSDNLTGYSRSYLHQLRRGNVVIAYHPDTGFWIVPRQEGDGEYIRPTVLDDPHPQFGVRKLRRSRT